MPEKYKRWVNYDNLDAFAQMAMEMFEPTLNYPKEDYGVEILPGSRGLSAAVFDVPTDGKDKLRFGFVVEILGTKVHVADLYAKRCIADMNAQLEKFDGYTCVGQDTAAMSVNDITGLGADPIVYGDLIVVGDDAWLADENRARALLQGFRNAADLGRFAIPMGETGTCRRIVHPDTADLAGGAVGVINPAERYTDGSKIRPGDVIYGLSAPGLNANGITMTWKIAEKLTDGFLTKISDDMTLADGVLAPTPIYAGPVVDMFKEGVEIHGLQPITGHGWSKIARVKRDLTYRIKDVPELSLVFRKLIESGEEHNFDVSPQETYYTWSMGVGYVLMAPAEFEDTISECAQKHGLESYNLGNVEKGERTVIMEPFGFEFTPK